MASTNNGEATTKDANGRASHSRPDTNNNHNLRAVGKRNVNARKNGSSAKDAAASMTSFRGSLKTALDQNRSIQEEILTRLQQLAEHMAENRRLASVCTRELYLAMEEEEEQEEEKQQQHFYRPANAAAVRSVIQSVANGDENTEVRAASTTAAAAPPSAAAAAAPTTDTTTTSTSSSDNDKTKKQRQRHLTSNIPSSAQELQTVAQQMIASKHNCMPRALDKKWSYDALRPNHWKQLYFVDPLGSMPAPNLDTLRRRQIERDIVMANASDDTTNHNTTGGTNASSQEAEPSHFFHHLSPPWSKAETKLLEQLVATVPRVSSDNSNDGDDQQEEDTNSIDFDRMAELLSKKEQQAGSVDEAIRDQLVAKQPRTAQECALQYQRVQCEKQKPLSKAEIAKVVAQVRRQQQGQQQQEERNNAPDNDAEDKAQRKRKTPRRMSSIDWKAVAESIGNNRSPWQCFSAYQKIQAIATSATKDDTKTTNTTAAAASSSQDYTTTWSLTEDELLFKYCAAMGPQFVLDVHTASDISRNLLPTKTVKQIVMRVNQSLLNPKLVPAMWTTLEERKLVLCHKIYRDDMTGINQQFPTRSGRSVREKWTKTLNPAFVKDQPFTQEDDALLAQVVQAKLQEQSTRLSNNFFSLEDGDNDGLAPDATTSSTAAANNGSGILSWSEIAQEYFPTRRPEHLKMRWTQELATDKDVLLKLKADILQQRGGMNAAAIHAVAAATAETNAPSSSVAAAASTTQQQPQQNGEATTAPATDGLDQFVLQVVKKRKNPKAPPKRKRQRIKK